MLQVICPTALWAIISLRTFVVGGEKDYGPSQLGDILLMRHVERPSHRIHFE